MGTQQILLIVLSVIIVGVAIAVGITMFRNQAYNSSKTSIAGEMQQYASQVVQWYKTPTSQGGAGSPATIPTTLDAADVAGFIGFNLPNNKIDTEGGRYEVTTAEGTTVVLTGYGKELKDGTNPKMVTTVTIPACTITSVASDEEMPADF